MILILSTPNDLDTEKVIEWLRYFQTPFFRLNDEDLMMGNTEFYYNPGTNKSYLEKDGQKLFFKNIITVWFRKFGFLSSYESALDKNSDFYRYIYSEFSSTRKLIFELLSDKKWLYKNGVLPSKPLVLKKAKDSGLKTPKTIVTSRKKIIENFKNNGLITKTIGEGKQVFVKNLNYPFMTLEIPSIDHLPFKFSPSYVQEKISKEYEVRIFFIDGKIFSMAIFSQNDKMTELDFRVFNPDKPIRFVPYQIPAELEQKIITFMKSINLNTGSLDFIKSDKGEYVFLEVNPSGQFGMTAYPCNYPLHKEVAMTLKKL